MSHDAEERMTRLTNEIHDLFRGYVNSSNAHADEHWVLAKEVLKLEKQNKLLKECLVSIHNVDGMQLDEKEYCLKKESIEVHRLTSETLEQINEMERGK